MPRKSSGNPSFRCKCNRPLGTCKNLNHPVKMEALVGPFIEGWVLLHALHVVLRLLQGKLQVGTVNLEIVEGRRDVNDGLAGQ